MEKVTIRGLRRGKFGLGDAGDARTDLVGDDTRRPKVRHDVVDGENHHAEPVLDGDDVRAPERSALEIESRRVLRRHELRRASWRVGLGSEIDEPDFRNRSIEHLARAKGRDGEPSAERLVTGQRF